MEAVRLDEERYSATGLVPLFGEMLEVGELYARLEEERYGQPWSIRERLDGGRKDIGDLSALETGRRDMRNGYTYDALEHEVVDCVWTLVVTGHDQGLDMPAICEEADRYQEIAGHTPRQLINHLSFNLACIDDIIDPGPSRLVAYQPGMRDTALAARYSASFRTVMALARVYDIDLRWAVSHTMDQLKERIARDDG